MFRSIQPLQFLLTLLAGWINRRQLDAIEYLREEKSVAEGASRRSTPSIHGY
jgi:hypothetical protein